MMTLRPRTRSATLPKPSALVTRFDELAERDARFQTAVKRSLYAQQQHLANLEADVRDMARVVTGVTLVGLVVFTIVQLLSLPF